MARSFLGLIFILHGALHFSYLFPSTGSGGDWPFDLTSSWILNPVLSDTSLKMVGDVLWIIAAGGFVIAGLSIIKLFPEEWWRLSAGVGALSSLLLFLIFFHPYLILPILIDILLIMGLYITKEG